MAFIKNYVHDYKLLLSLKKVKSLEPQKNKSGKYFFLLDLFWVLFVFKWLYKNNIR